MPNYFDLEKRVAALEVHHESIKDLIDLLNDVKGALRLFAKIGKFVKWFSGFLLAASGVAWVIKHFGQAP